MNGNQTVIKSPPTELDKEGTKMFAFDYSYWSFDGYKEESNGYLAPDGPRSRYCDQKKIFDDLGQGILKNAMDGYNASIFAYGQTGSGKSYSIIGTAANKGLVPQLCDNLFTNIGNVLKSSPDTQFEVTFSMIEIYNEIVRDLLSAKGVERKGLAIHERPGRGFHILEKDLKPTLVTDYSGIEKLMEQGNINKTIAETKMNATSSRAHTIVELIVKQTYKNDKGALMQRVSVIDLIDLAGSERTGKSETTGERFKEGVSINLSLSSLGNCIAALASNASSGREVKVPYRDSTLTKLLMNALGGNSKTVMIAAISPSDNNYAETLSTLRYADRAKQIKTDAKVNEDPKDKIIRELQEEINRLKKGGVSLDISTSDLSQKEFEKAKKEMEEHARKQIEENERQMESLKKSYEQKLAEALAKSKELDKALKTVNEKAKIVPHFSNINPDPMLTGSLKYLLEFPDKKKSAIIIGCADKTDIQVYGLGIQDRHAGITCENGEFFLEPFANSRVIKNGKQYEEKFQLKTFDRIVFGASLYYLFVDPSKFGEDGTNSDLVQQQISQITVDKIQQEIAEEAGLISSDTDRSAPDEIACINELIDLMPHIEEANQMSILLDKKIKYTPIILNPIVIGDPHSKVQPLIIVKKFGTTNEWLWDASKFIDRKHCMSEMYLDLKHDGKIDPDKYNFDPFLDFDTEPVLIGTAVIEPKCILHRIPLQDNAKVFDYRSKLIGTLNVELIPCDKQGIAFDNIEKAIIHDPETQLKELFFIMRINQVKCMLAKYKKIFCQYEFFGDSDISRTQMGEDMSKINFQKLIGYEKVDKRFIQYYSSFPLFVQVYGTQITATDDSKKLTTKQWFDKEKKEKNSSEKEDIKKLTEELERTKLKLKNLETLCNFAEKKNKKRIKTEYVRECILSNKPDVLNKLYDLISKDKND